ncbi:MAG: response regulator [Desulfovibrio sp.]|nr:MAG: response regulator [Desulfovibrio sp.]
MIIVQSSHGKPYSYRVMIVEDEQIIALAMRKMLMNLGCEVCAEAATGEAAVAEAAKGRPDLVFMDIMLEGEMDGVEAAHRITAEYEVPVVFATAFADEDTKSRAMAVSPVAFVAKPLDTRDLSAILEKLPNFKPGREKA